jgi:hypothetical protein
MHAALNMPNYASAIVTAAEIVATIDAQPRQAGPPARCAPQVNT